MKINMKNLRQFLWIFAVVSILNVSCRKDDPDPSNNNNDKEEPSLLVSQYLVYDGMALYYLWNEQMLGREPTEADTDARRYFESLLYRPTDVWSWITDDINALMRNFAGGESARAFGFSPLHVTFTNQQNQVVRQVAFVRYVYPGTPATEVGLRRGDAISEINGSPVNSTNVGLLFAESSLTSITLTVEDQYFQNPRQVTITPRAFAANPVLHSRVDSIGDRVIGYLFYTAFRGGTAASNFNEALFQVFANFKQSGVTDLVLDLRYNPGGEVSTAIYLASMIAPRAAVVNQEIFTTMNYNRLQNEYFDLRGWERASRLGRFNDDLLQDPLLANINPDGNLRVFIIATRWSASASELLTFGLRPFMGDNNVVHIGENTSGKYTVSWTVHAFDNFFVGTGANRIARAQRVHNPDDLTSAQREELRNWAMQPIVGTYTDRDGRDFVAAGTLIPNVAVPYSIDNWVPIGDERDFLFATAISLITGQPHTAVTRSASGHHFINDQLFSPQEQQLRRAVNVDNIEIDPEMLRKMLRSLR